MRCGAKRLQPGQPAISFLFSAALLSVLAPSLLVGGLHHLSLVAAALFLFCMQVFKAAKALAPSVVLIEEVDQVFITDRARLSLLTPPGAEPPNRIRKQLAAEVGRNRRKRASQRRHGEQSQQYQGMAV